MVTLLQPALGQIGRKYNAAFFGRTVCDLLHLARKTFSPTLSYPNTWFITIPVPLTVFCLFLFVCRTARPREVQDRPTTMVTPTARRQARELHLREQTEAMFESEMVNNITEMLQKLSEETLPAGYTLIKMALSKTETEATVAADSTSAEFVITIRLEELDDALGVPVIRRSLTIFPRLNYRMHIDGAEVSTRKAFQLTARPGKFRTTSEVLNVLARLKAVAADSTDLRATAAKLLDRVARENEDNESSTQAQFLAEQLRLANVPRKQRRYSPMLLCSAMVWDRTSPKLYEDLRASGLLLLPHKSTLRRLTSALSVREGFEIGTAMYLQMRADKLSPREKLVNIAMD